MLNGLLGANEAQSKANAKMCIFFESFAQPKNSREFCGKLQ